MRSCGLVELVGPGVNDGIAIEFIHGGPDVTLHLLIMRCEDNISNGLALLYASGEGHLLNHGCALVR
jgi:hypothetical protein